MDRIDLKAIDAQVHGPIRLGAMILLQVNGSMKFTELKKSLTAPDGSLSMHMGKLEEAGYVLAQRETIGKRPRTTYRISHSGSKALRGYLDWMSNLASMLEETDGDHGQVNSPR